MIERDAPITAASVAALRQHVGWAPLEARVASALEGSYAHFSVLEDGEPVAFARVVSDGSLYALIVDVMVHPAHQGRGLGRQLLEHTLNALEEDGIRTVQVVYDPALEGFYRDLGFAPLGGGTKRLGD